MVANLQQLDPKKKQVIYIKAFIKIYNWYNHGLVYKTHEIVELEKYTILRAKNFLNFGVYQFYKISLILCNSYVVPRNNKGNIFYLNHYID